VQNSEDYADEILRGTNPLNAVGQRYQGGSFAAIDYSRE
jgi:uronate dehydrogenase